MLNSIYVENSLEQSYALVSNKTKHVLDKCFPVFEGSWWYLFSTKLICIWKGNSQLVFNDLTNF